jgi:ribonuclease HI
MDYNARNAGGIGLEVVFPDSVNLENIKKSIGRYEGANIERLELDAIVQGMNEVVEVFENHQDSLANIRTITIVTDRYGLNDNDKTSPFKIREWRKNKWHNYEGKAIKNSDLLDKVDKNRNKLREKTFCSVRVVYGRRKFNRTADKLAKAGKQQAVARHDVAPHGMKIGKRRFDDLAVDYGILAEKQELIVHVYKKEPVRDQWEISVEVCEGKLLGKTFGVRREVAQASRI